MTKKQRFTRPVQILLVIVATALCGCTGVGSLQKFSTIPAPATPDMVASLYLVGDAGRVETSGTVLHQVKNNIKALNMATNGKAEVGVIFLGDNIYDNGMTEKDKIAVYAQLDSLKALSAQIWFVPGNHDWDRGGGAGYERILAQGAYISEVSTQAGDALNAELLPADGHPGPAVRNFGGVAAIVFLDSQWWLHTKYRGVSAEEAADLQANFGDRLRAIFSAAGDKPVIVAAHHPMRTHGEHEKNIWFEKYWPFKYWGHSRYQDADNEQNLIYTDSLRRVFRDFENKPLIYAAGHDHSLQLFDGTPDHVKGVTVVSGSGSNLSKVTDSSDLQFFAGKANGEKGFMRVNFYQDKSIDVMVFTEGPSSPTERPNNSPAVLRHVWTDSSTEQ